MKFLVFNLLLIFCLSAFHLAQEKDKYVLSSIEFEGNESFPDDELKSIIQSEENPFWLWRFFYNTISIIVCTVCK